MQPIEIFKAGTHTTNAGRTMTFTPGDLAAIAAAYDPSAHEAPLVIGHPEMDSPSYGWVSGLEFRDGALWAMVDGIDPALEEAVKAGKYKKISAAFYAPTDRSNPMPGRIYLRHVGFLGATPPAVKGLKPVTFADDGRTALVFGENETSDRERKLFERERELERREAESLLDRLATEARIRPGEKDMLLKFCDALSDNVMIAFGEGEDAASVGARELFLDFLKTRLPMVTFGEVAGGERDPFKPAATDSGVMGNMPKGHTVDSRGADMLGRAKAYQRKHGVTFQDAVLCVSVGGE